MTTFLVLQCDQITGHRDIIAEIEGDDYAHAYVKALAKLDGAAGFIMPKSDIFARLAPVMPQAALAVRDMACANPQAPSPPTTDHVLRDAG